MDHYTTEPLNYHSIQFGTFIRVITVDMSSSISTDVASGGG